MPWGFLRSTCGVAVDLLGSICRAAFAARCNTPSVKRAVRRCAPYQSLPFPGGAQQHALPGAERPLGHPCLFILVNSCRWVAHRPAARRDAPSYRRAAVVQMHAQHHAPPARGGRRPPLSARSLNAPLAAVSRAVTCLFIYADEVRPNLLPMPPAASAAGTHQQWRIRRRLAQNLWPATRSARHCKSVHFIKL